MDITDGGRRYWPRHMRGRPRHMASTIPTPPPARRPAEPPTADPLAARSSPAAPQAAAPVTAEPPAVAAPPLGAASPPTEPLTPASRSAETPTPASPAAEPPTPASRTAPVPASGRAGRLRKAVAIAGVAAGGLAACQPAPAAPKAAPVPNRVAIAGDSLVILAAMNGGDTSWADTQEKVGLGWQAENVQPRLDRDVRSAAASPDVLVVALGQNDAVGPGGLTAEDRSQLFTLLHTPHGSACVVLVKPHYAGTDPARRQGVEAYRAWVDQAAPSRPGTVVADWRPTAAAHPEYLAADGFHIEQRSAAGARAYTDLLREGARACGAPL